MIDIVDDPKKRAFDHSARIREFREETMSRRLLPPCCCSQQPDVMSMVGERVLIDGSRQFGRGFSYCLRPAKSAGRVYAV